MVNSFSQWISFGILIYVLITNGHILFDGPLEGQDIHIDIDKEAADFDFNKTCVRQLTKQQLHLSDWNFTSCVLECRYLRHKVFGYDIVKGKGRYVVNLWAIERFYKRWSNASDSQRSKLIEIYNHSKVNADIEIEAGLWIGDLFFQQRCILARLFYTWAAHTWFDTNENNTWKYAVFEKVA